MHEERAVGGVTEACKYNDHSQCNNPRCACDCHHPTVHTQSVAEAVADPQQLKCCPKCNIKRPGHERFCRHCGTKLGSLACFGCGQVCEPSDAFCFSCGCPLTKDAAAQAALAPPSTSTSTSTSQVVPRQFAPRRPAAQGVEEESYDPQGAEREVLAALQREVGQGGGPKENLSTDVGRTFSLPTGTFKVSGSGPIPGGIHRK